jgi:hypothetical protein
MITRIGLGRILLAAATVVAAGILGALPAHAQG